MVGSLPSAVEYDFGQAFLSTLVDSYAQEVIQDEHVNVLQPSHKVCITLICWQEDR